MWRPVSESNQRCMLDANSDNETANTIRPWRRFSRSPFYRRQLQLVKSGYGAQTRRSWALTLLRGRTIYQLLQFILPAKHPIGTSGSWRNFWLESFLISRQVAQRWQRPTREYSGLTFWSSRTFCPALRLDFLFLRREAHSDDILEFGAYAILGTMSMLIALCEF